MGVWVGLWVRACVCSVFMCAMCGRVLDVARVLARTGGERVREGGHEAEFARLLVLATSNVLHP